MLIHEFDVVALTRDLEGTHLRKGDLGTVVDILSEGKAYIVEFVLQTGFTAALEDVKASDVRVLGRGRVRTVALSGMETRMDRDFRLWSPDF